MIKSASQYHNHTSYERGKIGGHYLDRPNQPDVFKEYHGITPIPLPDEMPSIKKDLISVLKDTDINSTCPKIDINDLSMILRLTCALTAKARHGTSEFYYRSTASAGALYPTEIYVATRKIIGLNDGIYHYAIHRNGLFPLRTGDYSDYINKFSFRSSGKLPVLTVILTAMWCGIIYWR